jgi:transcription-repair coupling factor (superfamily II helicase)
MPNVNTILIQNAQNFGLAQLYQLRGRVGRRSNRGFCYFLTPDQLKETDDGYKRLQILKDNQDLGSGFIIASQDLELRGSGNILGDEQSGKVSDVGLETYSQMLDEALRSLGGIEVKAEREIEINLPVVTQIPEDYISNTKDRVRFYRRFFASKSVNEIGKMEQECIDRFGPIPQEFRSLIDTARLRVWLLKAGATSLVVGSDHTEIKFSVEVLQDTKSESTQALISRILDVCNRQIKNARLTPDGRIMFALNRKQFLDHPDQSFTDLKKLVTSIIGEKI